MFELGEKIEIEKKPLSQYYVKLTINRLKKLLDKYEKDKNFGPKNKEQREENIQIIKEQLEKYLSKS